MNRPAMPEKFLDLCAYNAERIRGLVHTEAYERRMRALQEEFDKWARESYAAKGLSFTPCTKEEK